MTFSTAVPLEARVEMEILGPRSALRSIPVVETVEGGIAEDVQPTLDSDGQSWIDLASGLREILPEDLLAIRESDRGHRFAQNFRVGTGNLRAAQLILEVEADSRMSRNDSSDLQYLSAREVRVGRPADVTHRRALVGRDEAASGRRPLEAFFPRQRDGGAAPPPRLGAARRRDPGRHRRARGAPAHLARSVNPRRTSEGPQRVTPRPLTRRGRDRPQLPSSSIAVASSGEFG